MNYQNDSQSFINAFDIILQFFHNANILKIQISKYDQQNQAYIFWEENKIIPPYLLRVYASVYVLFRQELFFVYAQIWELFQDIRHREYTPEPLQAKI